MNQALILVFGLLFAATATAQQYKWVDENGKTRYGDVPPPGVNAQRLKPPASGYSAPSAPAAPSADGKKPLTAEEAYQKRQKESKEAGDKADKERAEAAMKRANCEQAQNHLRTLESGQRMATTNAKGEPTFMDESQVASEKARAQKLVSEWCK